MQEAAQEETARKGQEAPRGVTGKRAGSRQAVTEETSVQGGQEAAGSGTARCISIILLGRFDRMTFAGTMSLLGAAASTSRGILL